MPSGLEMLRCCAFRGVHEGRAAEWRRTAAAALMVLAIALWIQPAAGAASAGAATGAGERALVLQEIEIRGNTRTSDQVVRRQLGLRVAQEVDGEALLAAVDELRRRELFAAVDFHTRPGRERGAVVLVLEVRERGPDLRLGTGLTDLDGWYLIPVELSLANALGRAEQTALQLRFGYRHAGLTAHYREGYAPGDRWHWGVDISLLATDRIYFDNGVEYAHRVERNGLGLALGRRFGRGWNLIAGLRFETVEADSTGEVWMDNRLAGAARGDEVAYADLPEGIAAGVGRRERAIVRSDLILDTRRGRRAGAAGGGVWGRLRLQHTGERRGGGFNAASLDLRLYREAPGGVLAGRAFGAVTGDEAPFFDRLYLGGLYSVRGVPSQSLSAPAGGTWSWLGSLEYRAALVGQVQDPRLAGSLFMDVGGGGDGGGEPGRRDAAVSFGWGVRWRLLPGVRLGLDAAAPLDGSPVDKAFRLHTALGWSF